MINKDFLESLSPVEIQMVHQYIGVLFKDRIKDDTSNFDNLKAGKCPYCGSKHFVKNGHDSKSGRQRYICRECHSSFKDSTDTFFSHSRVSYNTWMTFIGCEVVGLSLRQEEAICAISKTGCFNMRHRLYHALSNYQNKRKLEGLCEIDCAYTSINLKGSKKDMPMLSKKRGKHKPDKDHKQLRGIFHHKICLLTAVDENDHILFKIAGTGPEDYDKYQSFADRFLKKSTMICDEKRCIESFAKKNRLGYDYIPSGAFKSGNGNTLSCVNQIHQEFADLIRKKHGIGTRHLQSYMDFLVVTKELKYSIELKKMNTKLYMDIIGHHVFWTSDDICHIPMPIDVYEVYKEYGYTENTDISKNESSENRLHQPIS